MKHNFSIAVLFSALLLSALLARAYDFSAVSPSGHVLYYDIVNGQAVVVRNSSAYVNLSGHLIIPENVIYSGHTYSVAAISTIAFRGCGLLSAAMRQKR